jgi:uncharacterized protein (DUF433 family)
MAEPIMKAQYGDSWIEKNPGVIGGDACIRRTRIAVWMLVEAKRVGLTDSDLLTSYDPPLSQADLDAAWAYHEQNPEEIEQAIRENEEAMNEDL